MPRRRLVALPAVVLLVWATLSAGIARAGFPANAGLLAFRTLRDGNSQIYAVASDGSGLTNLSNSPSQEMDPAWSPDGRRIAFAKSFRAAGSPDIYVMNADGSGGSRLTSTFFAERQPAWSPDATRLVFAARTSAGGPLRLFVMNADGTGRVQITSDQGSGDDYSPAWSPDGTTIAFASTRGGGFPHLYTVHPDGSGLHRLTSGDAIDGNPTWSPDGTRIGRASCRERVFRTV